MYSLNTNCKSFSFYITWYVARIYSQAIFKQNYDTCILHSWLIVSFSSHTVNPFFITRDYTKLRSMVNACFVNPAIFSYIQMQWCIVSCATHKHDNMDSDGL